MRPDRFQQGIQPQRGFAIVTAIFLLMLMAALAALMVTFSTSGNTTSVQDIQGVRAYQAARAGLEWGIHRALVPASASCTGSATLPVLASDLAPFSVTVTCVGTPVTEGPNNFTMYAISSTATLGIDVGSPNYIERRLQATVER